MEKPQDNQVNYGRPLPPVETRWKKGQSGNPKGRPRKETGLISLLEDLLSAVCPSDPEGRTYAHQFVRSLLHQALKGNIGASKEILNRLAGRVPYSFERAGAIPTEASASADSKETSKPMPPPDGKLSLKEKNEILEIFDIEPIGPNELGAASNGNPTQCE